MIKQIKAYQVSDGSTAATLEEARVKELVILLTEEHDNLDVDQISSVAEGARHPHHRPKQPPGEAEGEWGDDQEAENQHGRDAGAHERG
jgi:hypothetical protein